MSSSERKKIADTMLELIAERGVTKTICPSEVARQVFSDEQWRERMDSVREVAQDLIERGLIEGTQKGKVIKNVLEANGPIRLRQRK